ncbi:hypothetical protein [Sphingobium sp. LMC3-1-1.1]|uniref:hypothetical protein n=1 Tax=Sphingobium sp. LMC3-1-1.1 TaxID=3135241 RepID=UPI00342E1B79
MSFMLDQRARWDTDGRKGGNMRQIAVIASIMLVGCASKPACENDVMAFVMSQNFIRDQLKSPASAQFPNVTDKDVHVTPSKNAGKCSFTVLTPVDSQNSFGAMMRTRFLVELAPDDESGKSWRLIHIGSY